MQSYVPPDHGLQMIDHTPAQFQKFRSGCAYQSAHPAPHHQPAPAPQDHRPHRVALRQIPLPGTSRAAAPGQRGPAPGPPTRVPASVKPAADRALKPAPCPRRRAAALAGRGSSPGTSERVQALFARPAAEPAAREHKPRRRRR